MAYHYKFFPSFFILLVFWNCAVFEPKWKTVPESLVREEYANPEQQNALKATKQRILNLRQEIQIHKRQMEFNHLALQLSQSKTNKHSQDRDFYLKKEALFQMKGDSQSTKRNFDEAQQAEQEKSKEETRKDLWSHKILEDEATLIFKEAELAEALAEHEKIKSEVAIHYQDTIGINPKAPDYIQKIEYDSQWIKRKNETRRRNSELSKIRSQGPNPLTSVKLEDTYE